MKKGFLLGIVLILISTISFAQTREIKEEGKTVFKPHAYLQLHGGAAHTIGEAKFGDLISPAAALNVGYNFSPVFGMRLGASGWQGKGAWVSPKQVYDFKFAQANLDFVFDLGSLFAGFNPDRVVSPYIFVGGGGAFGFDNDGAIALNTNGYDLEYLWKDNKAFAVGRGGLGLDIKLSKVVSINVEANANVTSDHFNSKKAGNADWQFNGLVGLKFNLGKTHTKTAPVYYEQPAPAPAPAPVVPATPLEPAKKAPVVRELPEMPAIHFAFDSDVVDTQKYATELAKIVSILKEYSELNATVLGYTDHKGSDSYNTGLSLRRAESVKKYLVEQGIAASRLSTSGKGKDPKTSGSESLTIQARRVEVTK